MNLLASLIIVLASPIGVGPQGAPARPAKGGLPNAPVTALLVTGEKTALSGTARGEVRRYALGATPPVWSPVASLRGAVTSLVATPQGPCAGTDAGDIALLPKDDGAEPKALGSHPGGVRALLVHEERRLFSAGNDGTIRAWALDGSGELGRLEGHSGPVTGLALARGLLWSVGWDRTLRGWKLSPPKRPAQPGKRPRRCGKQRTKITAGERELSGVVAEGDRLLTACWDGTLQLWDVKKRQPVAKELPARPNQEWAGPLAAHESRIAVAAPAESAVILVVLSGAGVRQTVIPQGQVPSALAFCERRVLVGRWDGTVGWAEPLKGEEGAK